MAAFGGKVYTDVKESVTLADTALKHSYDAETTAPTCLEDGYTTFTCARCGDTYKDDYVLALGHSYAAETTAPTCLDAGYTTYSCTRCEAGTDGHTYTGNEVAALGHSFKATTQNPTCLEDGVTTHTCTRCNFTDEAQTTTIPALGHSYDESVAEKVERQEPTCVNDGLKKVTCLRCDHTVETVLPALGHDFDESIEENVTDALNGLISVKCSRCEIMAMRVKASEDFHFYELVEEGQYSKETELYKEGVVPMPENFEDSTEWEVQYGRCGTKCLNQNDDGTPHTDYNFSNHVFDDVTIVEEATCTATAKWVGKCRNCGYEVTIDHAQYFEKSAEHSFKEHTFNAWTSVDTTYHKSVCTNGNPDCHEQMIEEHSYGDWEYQNDETFFADGHNKRYCTVCGFEDPKIETAKGTGTLKKIIGEILGASVLAAWIYTGISFALARWFGVSDTYLTDPPAFLK